MPFSSGTFTLYSPGNPTVTGTTISSSWANNTLSDIGTGLSSCVLKDGTQTMTANIPMAGFKFTGLAAGSAVADSARLDQTVINLSGEAGTNTVTATGPTSLAYAAKQIYLLTPAATNTGATTLNVNGLGAKNVFLYGAACNGGELVISQPALLEYDGTQFNIVSQANASGSFGSTFTFNGSGGSTGSLTITYEKTGNFVTINIPTAQATSGTGSTALDSNTALPAGLRPTNTQISISTQSFNNGGVNSTSGGIQVLSTGVIRFTQNGSATAYTNSSTCGTSGYTTFRYALT